MTELMDSFLNGPDPKEFFTRGRTVQLRSKTIKRDDRGFATDLRLPEYEVKLGHI
jgi:hypothetical protein